MLSLSTKRILALAALALSHTAAVAQTPCKTTDTAIHVAAGTLDKALASFSTQVSCPVQYDKVLTHSFRSPAVQGSLAPLAALTQLVRGTGLEAHSDARGLSVSQTDQNTIALQAATLQAQLGQAVKAQKLTQATADEMYKALAEVRNSVASVAKQQGFVSAAEKAGYERTFARAKQLVAKTKQAEQLPPASKKPLPVAS